LILWLLGLGLWLGETPTESPKRDSADLAMATTPEAVEGDIRRVTFELDDRLDRLVSEAAILGSWDVLSGSYDSDWSSELALNDSGLMGDRQAGDGIWSRTLRLQVDQGQPFEWDLVADGVELHANQPDRNLWNVASSAPGQRVATSDARHCVRELVDAGPVWVRDAVTYEIFLRSFKDGDGDGIGDLAGLISVLDVLNDGDPSTSRDLGIDVIWLMPIFESPSYHGYDTTDYYRIDPDYGTRADLDVLIEAAHARGIRVMLDLVINHTSSQHPWFLDSRDGGIYGDWYVWRDQNPGWTSPWGTASWHAYRNRWYYGIFWGGMPDLNYHQPEVTAAMLDVAAYWLDAGVDGFRIDAARYVLETGAGPGQQYDAPENIAWLEEFVRHCRAIDAQVGIVMEVWDTAETLTGYVNRGIPQAFDFPYRDRIQRALEHQDADALRDGFCRRTQQFRPDAGLAHFLSNHDQIRIATQLGGSVDRLRAAAALLLTGSGPPYIYYGEEIGSRNGPGYADEQKRLPFAWDNTARVGFSSANPWIDLPDGHQNRNLAFQRGDPGSLWSLYRDLIAIRRELPALRRGHSAVLETQEPGLFLRWCREGQQQVLVAINLRTSPMAGATVDLRFLAHPDWAVLEWRSERDQPPVSRANIDAYPLPPMSAGECLVLELSEQ